MRQSRIRFWAPVTVRPDGRVQYGLNVYRVKSPDHIQRRSEYYTRIASIPGAQLFPSGTRPGETAKNAQ